VIGRAHHLQDDRLFECYLAGLEGAAVEPPVTAHLAECAACAAHLRELAAFMDGLRAEADTETDAIFTPERLRIQQQQILHRIEHLGHAARVLSFPARLMGRRMVHTASRVAPRWAIAAAAVGLFVGVGVGTLIDPARGAAPAKTADFPMVVPMVVSPVLTVSEPLPAGDDDTFLSDLEMALSGPRNRELMPLDALTPRVQAVSNQLP
jgi:hypothetical protein